VASVVVVPRVGPLNQQAESLGLWGNTMNQSAIGSAVAGVCAILLVFGAEPKAFAQAGSTGGTLGNTDKSISGDREEHRPGDHHQSKPRAREKEATSAPSAASVTGRWHWTADCQSGHYNGAFTLSEASGGQFTGTFDGTNWQDIGSISGGEVGGGQLSFTRNAAIVVQHWRGRLTPGHISGSISGNENCTWQASK
jgi:hypothetical protein